MIKQMDDVSANMRSALMMRATDIRLLETVVDYIKLHMEKIQMFEIPDVIEMTERLARIPSGPEEEEEDSAKHDAGNVPNTVGDGVLAGAGSKGEGDGPHVATVMVESGDEAAPAERSGWEGGGGGDCATEPQKAEPDHEVSAFSEVMESTDKLLQAVSDMSVKVQETCAQEQKDAE